MSVALGFKPGSSLNFISVFPEQLPNDAFYGKPTQPYLSAKHADGRNASTYKYYGAFQRVDRIGYKQQGDCRNNQNTPKNKRNSAAWYYYDMVEATNAHDYTSTSGTETWTGLK